MEFKKLFQPIKINALEIKNRIVMPSMGLAYSDDYTFNDRYKSFYRERAQGGVGLMTIGPVSLNEAGGVPIMIGLFDDRNIESFKTFLDELHHKTDVKVAVQLMHMGRYTFSSLSGKTPMAPSPIPSKLTHETPREMTIQDIETIKQDYSRAALRAKTAGFDFVEILMCTGYLVSQFLSPVTNKRTDEYGGTIENRMRFGLEVIKGVRKAVGKDFAIGIRVAGNDFMKGGHTNAESALFAVEAEKAGVNAINVTGGWHETTIPQLTTNVPPGAYLYLARGIREKVNIPVFASNRLGDPIQAEKALRGGGCDMICWGRPLIADPALPNKIKQGCFDEITPCIACNQGCFDSVFSFTSVTCVLNPRAGKENQYRINPTQNRKKIMVAGGGPAGMEFALIAAKRGHQVTLYEKQDRLGGQINLAKVPPGKKEFQNIINSMERKMAAYGVEVIKNTILKKEMIQKNPPDVLVVATGAKPFQLSIPGIDKPHVVKAWDVLEDKVHNIGKNVVIIGGSATGCETAHFVSTMDIVDADTFTFLMYHSAEDQTFAQNLLHKSGRNITIVEMLPRFAENVGRTSRWSLMKSIRLMNIKCKSNSKLIEITDDAVIIEDGDGSTASIPADTVIVAVGVSPVDSLLKSANDESIHVIAIGDVKSPRKLSDAVLEGFEAALNI